MSLVGAVDRFQRRFSPVSIPLSTIYKFMDDQGPYLSAIITYYGFIAIFPLLLLASSILGFVLQGDSALQETVLNSALSTFPIIGDQLGTPEGLTGSTAAVVVGTVTALYGSLGLGQAIQNAVNISWAVPRDSRPNPFLLRLRSLLLLATAGVSVIVISVLSAIGSETEFLGHSTTSALRWTIRIVTVLVIGLVLTILFRLASARSVPLRRSAPGAFVVAVLWQALQTIGTLYVTRVIAETEGMNGTFALVLGLMGIIYVAAFMGVLGMEVNVVLARKLYPRALLTPFTDNVRLTDADKRTYAYYATMQRHKGYENIQVTWGLPPMDRPASSGTTDDGPRSSSSGTPADAHPADTPQQRRRETRAAPPTTHVSLDAVEAEELGRRED
ncbi:YihY/virulence factor BrkB family protein [Nocardioides bruguierae]|uniref:YihY/virulence factor BrkB family protein n=1 Tax=Nocardioides bruguierae TaxID=2945102 RepID=A0A9X2D6G8_9ACTN|nr:YihY/virulence factor BrkB family protein [Nocardioides bruguierae]MCM0620263.1 YihY/virulence factor BrkB family protein [Nocardioides bruguierae]